MRKRWHPENVCAKRRESLRAQARERLVKATEGTATPHGWKASGIHLVRGVDLRASLEEKAIDCHALTKWTAFVNRAGTLCHMVPKDGDLHVRIPLYYSTSSLTDRRLLSMLWSHVEGRFST